ncbi:MAG: hypothetical protein LBG44_03020 [Gemmatimonadota bacterium]|jgi:hypothetical protein|nr:hypothetical protein [Gemmatimonadota bacterium]
MRPLTFWISAVSASLVLSGVLALSFHFLALSAVQPAGRLWMLSVWTLGVMMICFGLAGFTAAFSPPGVREVAEQGSVTAAIEARREASRSHAASPFYNFAGWTTVTGILLLVIYFIVWLRSGG